MVFSKYPKSNLPQDLHLLNIFKVKHLSPVLQPLSILHSYALLKTTDFRDSLKILSQIKSVLYRKLYDFSPIFPHHSLHSRYTGLLAISETLQVCFWHCTYCSLCLEHSSFTYAHISLSHFFAKTSSLMRLFLLILCKPLSSLSDSFFFLTLSLADILWTLVISSPHIRTTLFNMWPNLKQSNQSLGSIFNKKKGEQERNKRRRKWNKKTKEWKKKQEQKDCLLHSWCSLIFITWNNKVNMPEKWVDTPSWVF